MLLAIPGWGQNVLSPGIEVQEISEMEYFLDESGELTKDDIVSASFNEAPEDGLRLDHITGYLWLRIKLQNPNSERIFKIIEFTDPSLFEVVMYEGNEGATYSGTSVPQEDKDYQGNNTSFLVDTGPQETEFLYVRIKSNNFITTDAIIASEETYHENEIDEHIFLGVYYGILVFIFLYALYLYFLIRSSEFLLYALYVAISMVFTGLSDGLTPMYMADVVKLTQGYFEVIITTISNIIVLLFVSSFLRMKDWSPVLRKWVLGVALGNAVIMILTYLVDHHATFLVMRLVALFNLGFIIWVAYRAVRSNASQSKFFFVAFAGYGFFILIFLLSLFRIIPFSFIVQYAIHFGLLFNIIVLSIGIAVRIYRQFNYSIELERQQKAQVSMKNEELERIIAERTSEINQKQHELRSIIDNSDNLIWLIGRNYEVLEFNKGFGMAWQLTYDKPLIKNHSILEQIDPAKERNVWRKRYDKVFAGKSFSFTVSYTMSGKKETFETNVYPIRDNDVITSAAFFSRNITERLAYEKELMDKNVALQQVNEELDSFVYSASHDLKAPLASIQGLIGLVRQEANEESRTAYYEMMDKSIKRLDQFIRDIIDYSRNTRIELKQEEINLNEMIQSVLEDLKFMTSDKFEVNIKPNDEYPLVTDPTRLRIIFRNLLSNAFAYGVKEGDIPRISIRWNIKKTKAIFEICDQGPGIPEEHKEFIFDMFYRANESSSGSGLGLYIVRESVKKMNGSVSVDSSPAGTCFRIAIPNQ